MSENRDEHFLRAVDLMHLPIGVYILAPDGRFFECNEGARKDARRVLGGASQLEAPRAAHQEGVE